MAFWRVPIMRDYGWWSIHMCNRVRTLKLRARKDKVCFVHLMAKTNKHGARTHAPSLVMIGGAYPHKTFNTFVCRYLCILYVLPYNGRCAVCLCVERSYWPGTMRAKLHPERTPIHNARAKIARSLSVRWAHLRDAAVSLLNLERPLYVVLSDLDRRWVLVWCAANVCESPSWVISFAGCNALGVDANGLALNGVRISALCSKDMLLLDS